MNYVNSSVDVNKEIIPISMVKIEAAGQSFQMGSENGEDYEKPVHTVKFTFNFYISKTEVTQREY